MNNGGGILTILMALIGGGIKVSTPYLFVSLGETLTEKSGRVNLGLEGVLVLGAVSGFGISYLTQNPWLGVLGAGIAGMILASVHGYLAGFKQVNGIALGIAVMTLGLGLSFFLGKPLIQPEAPQLPDIPLGDWSDNPAIQSALRINYLFLLGILLVPFLKWFLHNSRPGLILRMVGENAQSARAAGYSVNQVRLLATMAGGFLAGVGGSFLSLYYPGAWTEGLSSGQGLMAVALVIFAKWDPVRCLWASLLFGSVGSLGVALQSAGFSEGFHLFNAAPAAFALLIMVLSSNKKQLLAGRPAELSL